ncbi:MAG: beta-ketoacyl-[acyl-carrier-protein] synthase I [Alphaproteobacteria bacterium]|nr:beta-ketoacyl-[acyl-carrier-protein] synthase I [Alphaproteobacteria bacterium]
MTISNGTRRVVVTGLGIVSCIGTTKDEVLKSLKEGKSGITFSPEYAELGFRSQVHGKPEIDLDARIDRRVRRFMGDGAAYNYVAMEDAIKDAGLSEKEITSEKTGIIMGNGGPSTAALRAAIDVTREKGPKRVGPYAVPKAMSSTSVANLATAFGIKGVNYAITSACSTSAHCIGNAAEMIAWGKQDIMFAGGGEELDWSLSVLFDAMGAMSSKYNDTPEKASRPYDAGRDGFVIAGGGGTVILEEYEHAKARGATIYAEITGYGATSDGDDMVAPNGEGGERSMRQALSTVKSPVTYINTHGTSTPVGDIIELDAIRRIFNKDDKDLPYISSTKSMTGHSLGATGVQEAIYSLLMVKNGFVCPSINIENKDEGAGDVPIATKCIDNVDHKTVISNSFGFGGTNCTLAMSKIED